MLATLALVGAACGGPSFEATTAVATGLTTPTLAPSSPPASPVDEPEAIATPRPVAVVSAVEEAFVVYPRPGAGSPEGVLARNDWGQRLALPVLESAEAQDERWLRVRLPIRPNGSTGWVRARDVQVRRVHERIEVDLSQHLLIRFRDGEPVQELRVGVGSPSFPTTPGRFFVWAKLTYDPPGTYGVGALGLSGFSRVITDWVGGGRMAIHGTSDPTNRGRDVSHGCVRVYNPQMARLADVAIGTPVLIRP